MKHSHALFPLFSLAIIIVCVVLASRLPDQSFEGQGTLQIKNGLYTYTNTALGVAFDFPQTAVSLNGACTWEDHSYRPGTASVPLTVIEDPASRSVYLAPAYFYDLAGSAPHGNVNDGYSYTFKKCNKIENSLFTVDAGLFENTRWKMTVEPIENQAELDTHIKQKYGEGCSVDSFTPTQYSGSLLVHTQGDGKSLDETKCMVTDFLLYNPARKVMLVVTQPSQPGGGCSMYTGSNNTIDPSYGCVDPEIMQRIRLL